MPKSGGPEASIAEMAASIGEILGSCGPSLYLYGSAVLEDFRPGWSDIDLLCLTRRPLSGVQAERLLMLRQDKCARRPDNPYYRIFEGAMLPLEAFLTGKSSLTVYWGTGGQRLMEGYALDCFSRKELLEKGRLLLGEEVRNGIAAPSYSELCQGVKRHLEDIRRYARVTSRSLYAYGWLLDIARGLYTLRTGAVIAKTAAGEWALKEGLCPVPHALARAVEVRRNALAAGTDGEVLDYAESLGPAVQRFADVLEQQFRKGERAWNPTAP